MDRMRWHLQDASTAKALAFNKDVRTRCITLDGDDFNPGGTLTGPPPFPRGRKQLLVRLEIKSTKLTL